MKTVNIIKAFAAAAAAVMALSACENMDYPDRYAPTMGLPTIYGIQYTSGIHTEQAFMEEVVCILGDNLRSVNKLFFNDQEAVLNTSFITDNSLIVAVPKTMPKVETDSIYFINRNCDTLAYAFKVLPPAPRVTSMEFEYAKPGTEGIIYGNYFYQKADGVQLSIEFPGAEVTEIKSLEFGKLVFTIPADAKPGKVKVTTASGTGQSAFEYMDQRGLITNFDGEGNSGTKGIVPQGWNLKVIYSDEGGFDGYYAQVGDGSTTLAADAGWNEDFKISWWCGNWGGDPLSIKEGAGVPVRNLFSEDYFDNPANLALKFEFCVPSSNPWKAGALQVVFANYLTAANDEWQNNVYWQEATGLCRGFYRPWEATGSFDTADKWITVTMPISEFTYNRDGSLGTVPVGKESFDSFTFWPETGGVDGTECQPILRYDNIRIVPIK